jgi:hypothetical protein
LPGNPRRHALVKANFEKLVATAALQSDPFFGSHVEFVHGSIGVLDHAQIEARVFAGTIKDRVHRRFAHLIQPAVLGRSGAVGLALSAMQHPLSRVGDSLLDAITIGRVDCAMNESRLPGFEVSIGRAAESNEALKATEEKSLNDGIPSGVDPVATTGFACHVKAFVWHRIHPATSRFRGTVPRESLS